MMKSPTSVGFFMRQTLVNQGVSERKPRGYEQQRAFFNKMTKNPNVYLRIRKCFFYIWDNKQMFN
jgi:hypothetical protein